MILLPTCCASSSSRSTPTSLSLPLLFSLLLLLTPTLTSSLIPDNASELPTSELLQLATTALSSGKSSSALQLYDLILSRDPSDTSTLYKKASVSYALGHWGKAKDGFRGVLERNEGMVEARVKLGRVLVKTGEYEEAKNELDSVASKEEVKQLLREINSASASMKKAEKASRTKQYADCVASATEALEHSPNSERLRILRSNCYLHTRDYDSAVGDLARASSLTSTLPSWLMLRLSLVSAFLLNSGARELNHEGLAAVKRCLNADPDSKPCRGVFKALKKLDKEIKKWKNAAESSKWLEMSVALAGSPASPGLTTTMKEMFETYQKPLPGGKPDETSLPSDEPLLINSSPIYSHALSDLCHAYIMLGRTVKAKSACEASLAVNPEDIWGLVGKGDVLLAEEKWEDAVRVYNTAFEGTGKSDREILGRLQKAQRLLKQSTAKDYYKVLGVSRDADAKTIKRAYRKATLKSHPDKEGGSQEKMAAVNEAYEVLSNPELRQRFDNGEDPNDPQQGQGQGHPFFHQGGGFPGGFAGQHFEQFFQQAQGGGGGNGHTHTFRWG